MGARHPDAKSRLGIVAINDYPDSPPTFTDDIKAQVAVIQDWVNADGTWVEDWLKPNGGVTSQDLQSHLDYTGLTDDDAMFVYITGHGEETQQTRDHVLLLRDDDFDLVDLISRVLRSGAGHIAIVVDTCHAGALKARVEGVANNIRRDPRKTLATHLLIVAMGYPDEQTRRLELATLITKTLELARSPRLGAIPTEPYLSQYTFFEQVSLSLKELRSDPMRAGRLVAPKLLWPDAWELGSQPTFALPNPAFDQRLRLVSPATEEVALSRRQVDDYWVSKASGRPDNDAGWYFTGRATLMDQMTSWLADADAEPLLLVTGPAGSGKSAMIARAVTLADQTFRAIPEYAHRIADIPPDQLPLIGSIDVAVDARGKSDRPLFESLASHLETVDHDDSSATAVGEAESIRTATRRLVERVAGSRSKRMCIVIDGLDEATAPRRVISEIVGGILEARVDGHPAAKVMVGVRTPTIAEQAPPESGVATYVDSLRAIADAVSHRDGDATSMTLSAESDETPADIAKYVVSLLVGALTSPYAADWDAAKAAGEVIAQRLTPSFLDAKAVASELRSGSTLQQLNDPEWLAGLKNASIRQLGNDIVAPGFDRWSTHEVLAVMRATAMSRGSGMPWGEVWPTVAEAVQGHPIRDVNDLIGQVLASPLAGYLLVTAEHGEVVYRPNHDLLTKALRDSPKLLVSSEVPRS